MEENKDNIEGEVLASLAEDEYFPNLGVNIYPPVRMLLNNDDVVAENEDGTMGPPNLALWALTARTDSLKLNQVTAASIAEVEAGVITNKYISPATTPRVNPASIAEVEAGTINNKYVSPATLPKVIPASAAEVAAGTVTNKYVSPATLPKSSGGAPAYYKVGMVYSTDSTEVTNILGGYSSGSFLLPPGNISAGPIYQDPITTPKPDWLSLTPLSPTSPFFQIELEEGEYSLGNCFLRGVTLNEVVTTVIGGFGVIFSLAVEGSSANDTYILYTFTGTYGLDLYSYPSTGVLGTKLSNTKIVVAAGKTKIGLKYGDPNSEALPGMKLGITEVPTDQNDLVRSGIFGFLEIAKIG